MLYAEHPCAQALTPYLERYWAFSLDAHDPPHVDHVVLPHGGCNITLIESPVLPTPLVTLQGPNSAALQLPIRQGVRYRGVRVRAGALKALLGLTQTVDWPSQHPQALQLWHPALAQHWQSALVQAPDLAAFAQQADRSLVGLPRQNPDPVVQAIVAELDAAAEPARLARLLAAFSVGERQARRRFVEAVGLTPKVYARLRRIRRVCVDLARASAMPGAELAACHGYADQAHLARDIRAVFGRSSTLLQHYLRQIQHRNVAEWAP